MPPQKKSAAGSTPLRHGQMADRAFAAMLGEALARMRKCQGNISPRRIEALHEMRAALRRVRTVFVFFAPCIEKPVYDGFTEEMRRWGQALGEPRDWDVLVDQTLPEFLLGQPKAPWFLELRRVAEASRIAAYARLKTRIRSPALDTFKISITQWAEARFGEAGMDRAMHRGIERLAPALMDRLAHRVEQRGSKIGSKKPAKLHAIRKSLKKLRYSAEAIAPLYESTRVERFVKAAKKLEKRLGRLNDVATARRQAALLSCDNRVALLPAVAAMEGWCRKREKKALARLKPAWTKFRKTEQFWH
jgi:triphosphatase